MNNFLNYVSNKTGIRFSGTVNEEPLKLYFKDQEKIMDTFKKVMNNSGHIYHVINKNLITVNDKVSLITQSQINTIDNNLVIKARVLNNDITKSITIKWKERVVNGLEIKEEDKSKKQQIHKVGNDKEYERVFEDVDKQLQILTALNSLDTIEITVPIHLELLLFTKYKINNHLNKKYTFTVFSSRYDFNNLTQTVKGYGNVENI